MLITSFQDSRTRIDVFEDIVVVTHLGLRMSERRNGRGVVDTMAELLNNNGASLDLYYKVKDLLRETEASECKTMRYKTEIIVENRK